MGKKTHERLFEKLSYDEQMEMHRCEHVVDGLPISIFLMFVGCDPEENQVEELAANVEAVLGEWSTLKKTIVGCARDQLVQCGRLKSEEKRKVTAASLIPFSFEVTVVPDQEPFFSLGLYVAGVLTEHEYLEYNNNFLGTQPSLQLGYTE